MRRGGWRRSACGLRTLRSIALCLCVSVVRNSSSKLGAGLRFLARRLLQAVPLLFVISGLVFLLIHAAPGGPLAIYLSNPNVRPEDIERLRRALGLDRPLRQQYWSWLAAFAGGDWGYSFSDGRPVTARIVERLPATLELVGVSIVAALALTVATGVVFAVGRGRCLARVGGNAP